MKFAFYRDGVYVTDSEVARAIAVTQHKHGYLRALRQIRLWTDHRLLKARTRSKRDDGASREYLQRPTIPVSAVFQELSSLGLTADQLRPVAQLLCFEESDKTTRGRRAFGTRLICPDTQLSLTFDRDSNGRRVT